MNEALADQLGEQLFVPLIAIEAIVFIAVLHFWKPVWISFLALWFAVLAFAEFGPCCDPQFLAAYNPAVALLIAAAVFLLVRLSAGRWCKRKVFTTPVLWPWSDAERQRAWEYLKDVA